jgi:long-chain acyl-CoA synthetase
MELTLRALLAESVSRYAGRVALARVDGQSMTYAEVGGQVRLVSRLLHDQGVVAGDRVAILGENMPEWGIAYFAVTTMGAIAVPILADFHPTEIRNIIARSGARLLIVSERLYPKVDEAENLPPLLLMDDFSVIPPATKKDRLKSVIEGGRRAFLRIKEAVFGIAGVEGTAVKEDDVAAIVFTSGTTGWSKGVILTHRNIVADAIATTKIIDIGPRSRMLSILPLAHTYECTLGLVTPLLAGASVHYVDKPPTAAVLMPALASVRPTIMLAVPLVIEKIYKTRILPKIAGSFLMRRAYKIPFLRKWINRSAGKKLLAFFGGELKSLCIGGAALAPDVEHFLREARFPYAVGYGLTETSPLATGIQASGQRYLSCGPVLPGVSVRIDAPDPVTGVGEIQIKGPTVMKGYYNDPERTRDVFTDDGWFKSGDLGSFDKEGYLYIKGRLKNMILGPSGENIYPEEIESVINESPLVLESLVYADGGQVTARVYLNHEELDRQFGGKLPEAKAREKVAAILEGIRRDVNARVSGFSRIVRIREQAEPFEKTPTQKIKRNLYQ